MNAPATAPIAATQAMARTTGTPRVTSENAMNVQNVAKGGSGAGTFYFKVTDAQATKLAFAADNGKLWLALRPAAGAKTAPPSVVTAETLMLGVSPQAVYQSLGGRK